MSAWLRQARYVLGENPVSLAAFVLLVVLLAIAAVGPALVPYDPLSTDTAHTLALPSRLHWFGTDQLGRDLFSRVVVASRLDLVIAASAVLLSFTVGTAIGGACGYFGGFLDRAFGRTVDVIMAFPLFVLAMAMVAALGNTVANIIYATAIINIPFYFRLARTEVNVLRHAGYVEAARLAGNRHGRILVTFLLPNAMPPIVVQMSLNMGWAILTPRACPSSVSGSAPLRRSGALWSRRGRCSYFPENGGWRYFPERR